MKKLWFISILILVVGVVGYLGVQKAKGKIDALLSEQEQLPHTPDTPLKLTGKGNLSGTETLFVPYWSLGSSSEIPDHYNRLIYFGVTPGSRGIDTNEAGYTDLALFHKATADLAAKKYLALRMTDSDQNFTILENKDRQQMIIADTLEAAKSNGFSGVVVDLELRALPFDSLIGQINTFISTFSREAKAKHLVFAETFYGDTFYRLRPFDIKTLTGTGDEVMIMAYDFHKANGAAGPNFPLQGHETYGYDMDEMIQDFLKIVPSNRITVVFGMFGYDWQVGPSGVPVSGAVAVTDEEIDQKFLSGCEFTSCEVKPDGVSRETKITYKDEDGKNHIIWFEDDASVNKKKEALKSYHIDSFGYWAYSYF